MGQYTWLRHVGSLDYDSLWIDACEHNSYANFQQAWNRSGKGSLIKELIIEGSCQIKKENPKYIRDKLMNFLTEDELRKANGDTSSKGGKSKGKREKAVES